MKINKFQLKKIKKIMMIHHSKICILLIKHHKKIVNNVMILMINKSQIKLHLIKKILIILNSFQKK